ncbi:hypothetical protein LKL35_32500 [Streptomyces sp. ET3-23]|uniref:hypothetical protein n=1 Tax=Streptomyces sp. ET3-23 TaxID=2885643 RepID=UPI001D0F4C73|nr:hypothetical protein [Streptomyces sp. ET3-23]MCC2280110.1 hypothetical protein [Streptomyces sp. ET3-23]
MSHVVELVVFFAALFTLSWDLTLVALLVTPLFRITARRFSRLVRAARGCDTVVVRRGRLLSGGQCQRLAIARAADRVVLRRRHPRPACSTSAHRLTGSPAGRRTVNRSE